MYVHLYTHTHKHTYIRTYIHTSIHTHTHPLTHIHVHICVYVQTNIHTCTHAYVKFENNIPTLSTKLSIIFQGQPLIHRLAYLSFTKLMHVFLPVVVLR